MPERRRRRLDGVDDGGPYDRRVANGNGGLLHMPSLIKPRSDAADELVERLAAMGGNRGVGHPPPKGLGLVARHVGQRMPGPPPEIAVPNRLLDGRIQPTGCRRLTGGERWGTTRH